MERHSQLIDKIYEASALPELWPGVLDAIARSVDAAGMVLLANSSDQWSGAWAGFTTSPSFHEAFLDFVKLGVAQRTQATPRLLALDHPGFLTEEAAFTRDEWKREPHTVEWSSKWGFDHVAATAVHSPSGEALVFHLERNAALPSFNRTDLALLDVLRPHLARAGMLAARWRLERLRIAAEALALIGLPALILDRTGHVLAANNPIQQMTEHVCWLPRDRVSLRDAAADSLLRRGLASLGTGTLAEVCSFPARAAPDILPVVVHLIPTPGQARDLFEGALGVLVFTPVASPMAPDVALIRGLFDLTPSEARVAQGIADGLNIEEMATRANVGRETIRTHVKAVLAKTGTRRQSEAAALLARVSNFPIGQQ